MVASFHYEDIELPFPKNVIRKLKQKIISGLIYLDIKINKRIQFIDQKEF